MNEAIKHANMSWVTDTLATGGDLSFNPTLAAKQIRETKAVGITDIIDMRSEAKDHETWADAGVRYEWLGTTDAIGHHIPPAIFNEIVKTARRVERQGGKLLVHCHMGINRGPSGAYAVLLDRGMNHIEAYDAIRAARPQAGLYYAEDALAAHHTRRIREGKLGFDRRAEIRELRAHIKSVMTAEERRKIQHIIRTNHENDAKELSGSRA